jgi:hypothetical protein
MPKFIIIWNAGYGENAEIIEAEDESEAQQKAYDAWRDEVESNADYTAKPYSDDLADSYSLEMLGDDDA